MGAVVWLEINRLDADHVRGEQHARGPKEEAHGHICEHTADTVVKRHFYGDAFSVFVRPYPSRKVGQLFEVGSHAVAVPEETGVATRFLVVRVQ